ncbi:MAG TPA: GntR family transcriptional regulator [Paenirhodobacter sp.]
MLDDSDISPAAASHTLAQQIHHGLRQRILRHDLRMGTALREEEVAQWFSASRVPAREALRKLEQEGLVARLGRKYAVRRYSSQEILVTYRLRAALEDYSVELAAGRLDAAQMDGIQAILDQQRQHATPAERGAFSALDTAFHLAIAAAGGNGPLLRELGLIMDRITLFRGHEIDTDSGPLAAYDDHCRIFDAVRRGDPGTAKAELAYHYQTALHLHRAAAADGDVLGKLNGTR